MRKELAEARKEEQKVGVCFALTRTLSGRGEFQAHEKEIEAKQETPG